MRSLRFAMICVASNSARSARATSTGSDADERLLRLGSQLEAAWAEQSRLDRHFLSGEAKAPEKDPAGDAAADAAYNRTSRIVNRIEAAQARTIAGLRVKARAIAWCHHGERPVDLMERPTTDVRLAQSIIADLLASSAEAPPSAHAPTHGNLRPSAEEGVRGRPRDSAAKSKLAKL